MFEILPNTYRSRYVSRVGTGIVDSRGEEMVREPVSCLDFRPERSEKADRKGKEGKSPPSHPISALYILNHFAFASIRAYRLRGKRLKKAADSGEKRK